MQFFRTKSNELRDQQDMFYDKTFLITLKFDRHLDDCHISERYDHYNIHFRGFQTSRDLALRHLTAQ